MKRQLIRIYYLLIAIFRYRKDRRFFRELNTNAAYKNTWDKICSKKK